MKRSFRILIAGALLAACGSGDQATSDSTDTPPADTASVDTAEPAGSASDGSEQPDDSDTDPDTDTESDTDSGTGSDTGDDTDPEPGDDTDPEPVDDTDPVTVTDIDDVPTECRQIMSGFLREIEPLVADIDWNTASVASLQAFEENLTEPVERLDRAMADSGCDVYDFGPDGETGLAFTLELARQDAPGVVGYLEFVSELTAAFDPQNADADLPTDCDEAIAYVRRLVEQTEGLSHIPAAEFGNVTAVVTTVQFDCPAALATAFFEDPAVAAWAEN